MLNKCLLSQFPRDTYFLKERFAECLPIPWEILSIKSSSTASPVIYDSKLHLQWWPIEILLETDKKTGQDKKLTTNKKSTIFELSL